MDASGELRGYSVNPPCCNGCGACVEMEPELFGLDEAGDKALPLRQEAPQDVVRRAMAFCPHDCIEIEGD